eukprot:scaffold42680_cov34-Tisochrysis_lutea.AAC.1
MAKEKIPNPQPRGSGCGGERRATCSGAALAVHCFSASSCALCSCERQAAGSLLIEALVCPTMSRSVVNALPAQLGWGCFCVGE